MGAGRQIEITCTAAMPKFRSRYACAVDNVVQIQKSKHIKQKHKQVKHRQPRLKVNPVQPSDLEEFWSGAPPIDRTTIEAKRLWQDPYSHLCRFKNKKYTEHLAFLG